MAITHGTALRNAIADLVVDSIDAGSGAGTLEFQTSSGDEVATLTFSDPAFGDASSGTATANSISPDASATGGTMGRFQIKDSTGTVKIQGTVAAVSGGDINMSSLSVGAGDTVTLSSLTYTAPA
jgi:hypothetical protein